MSGEHLAWRPLPLPPSAGLPVLLVSATIGTASYTVHVTDMANMWTENLDRKAICMRAWSQNTSIDPSDTAENMAKFLASLETALNPSRPGHDGTSLTLSPATTADAGEDGLTITITCAIPGLAPLKWHFHLRKSPPSSIATDLVLPLIQAHYAREREVESLLQALGHKDAVMTKLSDKLGAMGTGLEHVFTALAGRRKVNRSVADDKVKGLALFDQRKWRADLQSSNELHGPNNTRDLVQSVFGQSGLQYGTMMEIDKSPALNGWWHDLKGTLQLTHRSQTRPAPPAIRTPSPPTRPINVQDEDDFQFQATPPLLRSSAEKPNAASDAPPSGPDDVSTADAFEDESVIPDCDQLAAAVPEPARQSEHEGAPSGLSTIGGKNLSAAPRSPMAEAKSLGKEKAEQQLVDNSETASEASDDDNGDATPPPPPPRHVPTATGSKKGGLGKIGGGAPKMVGGTDKSKAPLAEEETREAGGAPAHSKLGTIGNKIGRGASLSPRKPDSSRGRASTRKEDDVVQDEPRETSQERADGRRVKLKRDLERKAAAGPAKKKRRF